MPQAKFRVAIWYANTVDESTAFIHNQLWRHTSGGGIGGLCLAVALARYPDIQVNLYEAAARFKEIGAGVTMWARTWEILAALGLQTKLAEIAHASPDLSTSAKRSAFWNALQLIGTMSQVRDLSFGNPTSPRKAIASIRSSHHVSITCLYLVVAVEAVATTT